MEIRKHNKQRGEGRDFTKGQVGMEEERLLI
jgi:hypothetical protein